MISPHTSPSRWLTVFPQVNHGGRDAASPSLSLYKFWTENDVRTWVHGSDADIGGMSTSNWALGEDGRAKFSGVMRLKVKPEIEGRLRGGYAGIRARVRFLHGQFQERKKTSFFLIFLWSYSLSPLCLALSRTILRRIPILPSSCNLALGSAMRGMSTYAPAICHPQISGNTDCISVVICKVNTRRFGCGHFVLVSDHDAQTSRFPLDSV